jgi:hypothetical protein
MYKNLIYHDFEGNKLFTRSRRRWKGNIKINITEVGLESVFSWLICNDEWRILLKILHDPLGRSFQAYQTVVAYTRTFRRRAQMVCRQFVLTRCRRVTACFLCCVYVLAFMRVFIFYTIFTFF